MSHSMRGNGSKGVSNKRDAVREKSSSEQIRCNVRSKNDKDSVGIRTKERTGTSRNRIHMEKDCAPFRDDTFPHWLPWILFPVTLLIRLLYIQQPTNWWILHPDEIFQTVEGKCLIIFINHIIHLFIAFLHAYDLPEPVNNRYITSVFINV